MIHQAALSRRASSPASVASSHRNSPRRTWLSRALVTGVVVLLCACAQLPAGPAKSSIISAPLDAYMQ